MTRSSGRNDVALTLITAAHTLAWLSIESCMAYLLYAGAARRTDRRAALAGAVVAAESLIFAANRFRCPLTLLAEHFGAADGSVTDIWLPRWLAHNLPVIHVPLLAAAVYLNGRNLRERAAGTVIEASADAGAHGIGHPHLAAASRRQILLVPLQNSIKGP